MIIFYYARLAQSIRKELTSTFAFSSQISIYSALAKIIMSSKIINILACFENKAIQCVKVKRSKTS